MTAASQMSQVERAIEILKKGGIVAYPTDTIYGLGCDVFNIQAVKRIYAVKQRPETMALPVLLADANKLPDIAVVPDMAWRLIERFWPGGLTLVLKKRDTLPDIITAGGGTVAVRVPKHDVPVSLIRGLGRPITGTSANISNKPSPLTAGEVEEQLDRKVDLIIDGGRCSGGVESTVVDVTGESPLVLRAGIIPEAEIKKAFRKIKRR